MLQVKLRITIMIDKMLYRVAQKECNDFDR